MRPVSTNDGFLEEARHRLQRRGLVGRLGKFVERMLAITASPGILEAIEPPAVILVIAYEVARSSSQYRTLDFGHPNSEKLFLSA
jgi:hypothetical protein